MLEYRPDDHLLDEKLAEFTDQLLNQERGEALPPLAEEENLQQLQETVVQLKQSGLSDHPEVQFSARLFSVLQREWKRFGPKPGPVRNSSSPDQPEPFGQIRNTLRKITETWGRQIVFGLTALMLLVLLFLPKDVPLTGSSGTSTGLLPVEWIVGVFCIGLLIWLLSKKQN
ncbi:hypothetical protein LARV_01415 [Longilinea arvoryzae]|uniref:Uncharacterized protein n=1 Tax=Longilinea arvoryzae TaxID=360412 RepID=A0A0S7B834_9CHLR|nr:hypothetical protein [Longilinea arvoryzae]GAP13660.1 hypothetical protein LARV_01415 [Longilinea arvoryzae]